MRVINHRPYYQGYPFLSIVRWVSDILGGCRNSQYCDVDSASGFTCIFVLHENSHTTRVITTAEELGTMFKNNLACTGD